MLAAIDLDDQLRLPAREVGDIGFYGEPAGEFRPVAGEEAPESELLRSRVVAQLASPIGQPFVYPATLHPFNLAWNALCAPTPRPLPFREGSPPGQSRSLSRADRVQPSSPRPVPLTASSR